MLLIEVTDLNIRQGRPGKSCECAIALAMKDAGCTFPIVGTDTLGWGLCSNRHLVPTPPAVAAWLLVFDRQQPNRHPGKPISFELDDGVHGEREEL